jgi:hypothetical protein
MRIIDVPVAGHKELQHQPTAFFVSAPKLASHSGKAGRNIVCSTAVCAYNRGRFQL